MTSAASSDLPFMDAFPTPEATQWRAAVDRVLKGGDFEKRLVAHSADGVRIEPLYRAAGETPRPLRGRAGRWSVCARVDHPEPDMAQALALADLEGGADALTLSFSGARAARGFGLAADDVATLDAALDGVMLDLISLRVDPAPEGEARAMLLSGLVEARGLTPSATAIAFGLDPVGVMACGGADPAAWPSTARGTVATVKALKARGFAGPFLTADARPWHEAGASEAQELGAVFSVAIAYLRLLEAGGLPLDEARDAISFVFVADTDAFLTIAKLRAARLIWERVQGACGLEPKPMILHVETAWRALTRRDPWVNMLRGTVATFAAGTGGADSLTVLPFTAALGLPDGFARRVARNTQLVLLEEAHLWRVADPAAGSGAFEALTLALCEQGWSKLQDLEREASADRPGIVAALANGHVAAGLARQREARARAVATRREPLTGTSEFANLKEAAVSVLAAAPRAAPACGALPSWRLAEAFEALRDRADAAPRRPDAFLATLGPIAEFSARAGFARNLFESGGIAPSGAEAFTNGDKTDIAALVAAFRASGARLACLCGSDSAYDAEGVAAAKALAAAGATIWLAGRPGEREEALRAAGVKAFIFAGCDVIGMLEEAQNVVLATLSK